MLLILYGATSMMGNNSADYLEARGFSAIEKYAYAPSAPIMSDAYKKREYVSREEFYENTDSLFRYELGGVYRGFNQAQIADAVANKTNALLMIAASNIDFVAKIKRVYEDKVCLIYSQIDDTTLKDIIHNRPNITPEEEKFRFGIGQRVKENYAAFCRVFDKVVIYGGEDSVFNYENLYRQYDAIIDSLGLTEKKSEEYADVFISYSHKDSMLCHAIIDELQSRKISTFYDGGIPVGVEWTQFINDKILHAKVFVPIITENSLRSASVMSEIEAAFDAAKNNGTLIIPFFLGRVIENNSEIFERLSSVSGVFYDGESYSDAAKMLSQRLQGLFSSGEELKLISEQVENYLCLKMYEPAVELQRKHVELCGEVLGLSGGTYISEESYFMSRIKLVSILLDMEKYEDALEEAISALNARSCDSDSTLDDMIADQFAICCVRCKLGEAQVGELIRDRLLGAMLIGGEKFEENLINHFHGMLGTLGHSQSSNENTPESEKTGRIALYGESILSMFEELLNESHGMMNNSDLIMGYERVLDYCKYMGIKGEIADKCINAIRALKQEDARFEGETKYSDALKIYLGEPGAKSGEYDAFISYKSQDEVLAQKIYDYLTQTGKEVFFAKESLARLGDCEYEEKIFEAMEKSRHMVLVASDPDYLKTPWVKEEWDTFNNEIREGRKDGNLVLVLTDNVAYDKGRLPIQLRQKEIIKMSEYKVRLINYLR